MIDLFPKWINWSCAFSNISPPTGRPVTIIWTESEWSFQETWNVIIANFAQRLVSIVSPSACLVVVKTSVFLVFTLPPPFPLRPFHPPGKTDIFPGVLQLICQISHTWNGLRLDRAGGRPTTCRTCLCAGSIWTPGWKRKVHVRR